jgi:hypothetical protein
MSNCGRNPNTTNNTDIRDKCIDSTNASNTLKLTILTDHVKHARTTTPDGGAQLLTLSILAHSASIAQKHKIYCY